MMNKRFLIISCTLFIVAIITWLLAGNTPSHQHSLYAKQLPLSVDDWVGRDIDVDEQTLRILETEDVVMRDYTKEGSPHVQMCIVYASNNRKVAHPPEVCYKGGGWSLEEKKPVVLLTQSAKAPEFKVIKLILEIL